MSAAVETARVGAIGLVLAAAIPLVLHTGTAETRVPLPELEAWRAQEHAELPARRTALETVRHRSDRVIAQRPDGAGTCKQAIAGTERREDECIQAYVENAARLMHDTIELGPGWGRRPTALSRAHSRCVAQGALTQRRCVTSRAFNGERPVSEHDDKPLMRDSLWRPTTWMPNASLDMVKVAR